MIKHPFKKDKEISLKRYTEVCTQLSDKYDNLQRKFNYLEKTKENAEAEYFFLKRNYQVLNNKYEKLKNKTGKTKKTNYIMDKVQKLKKLKRNNATKKTTKQKI